MKISIWLLASFVMLSSLSAQPVNQLTAAEKKAGWKLLFDGKSLGNFHAYGNKAIGPRWKSDSGVLTLHTGLQEGGDLVTNQLITGDFELKIDWKAGPSSNSGIFFFVDEKPEHEFIYHTGLELQIQDNRVYANEKPDIKKLSGDLYGLQTATNARPRKLGEWNQYHVIFRNNILDVYLNGSRIQHVNLKGDAWKHAIQQSALKKAPVGKGILAGRIGIQDWHSTVSYRNIKIRVS